MGGIPTNFHGEVVTVKGGDPGQRRARPVRGRRGGLRLRPRRQPARLEQPDRPRRLRPRRRPPARRDIKPGRRPLPCPRTASDLALARLDRFRFAKGGSPTAEVRVEMQRAMQAHCAVFRTEATDGRGRRQARRDLRPNGRRPGHRPKPDLEHRPDRDARARQSDRPGQRHHAPARSTARKAAAPTPTRIIPSATTGTG